MRPTSLHLEVALDVGVAQAGDVVDSVDPDVVVDVGVEQAADVAG